MNVIIRGVRFLLNMAKREPLASKLDLKTLSDATGSDFFWPGDADPEKVIALTIAISSSEADWY